MRMSHLCYTAQWLCSSLGFHTAVRNRARQVRTAVNIARSWWCPGTSARAAPCSTGIEEKQDKKVMSCFELTGDIPWYEGTPCSPYFLTYWKCHHKISLKNNDGWLGVTHLDSSLCWDFWTSLRNLIPFSHYSQKLKRILPFRLSGKKKKIRQLWVFWGCFWSFWAERTSTAWQSCTCVPHPCTRKWVQMWDSFSLLMSLGKRSSSKMSSSLISTALKSNKTRDKPSNTQRQLWKALKPHSHSIWSAVEPGDHHTTD